MSAWSQAQVRTAAAVASALSVPLVLAHVIEPLHIPAGSGLDEASIETSRRAGAEADLANLAPAETAADTLVLSGEPAAEIAATAARRKLACALAPSCPLWQRIAHSGRDLRVVPPPDLLP